MDYSQKEKKFSKTEFFVKPWKAIRDQLEAVEGRYDEVIENSTILLEMLKLTGRNLLIINLQIRNI